MTCICCQHTRWSDWETFKGQEEFLDEVQRKEDRLDKRMVYKKKEMREKYFKEPLGWILGTIKSELNLFNLSCNETLEDLQDHHDTALEY
jgi:hypothetical protein